jgi:hypothetical protein
MSDPTKPRLKPAQVRVQAPGTCIATLGHMELENVAAVIVLYHWENHMPAWTPISRRMILHWLPKSAHLQQAARNPFWKLDVRGFIDGGWITGWDEPGEAGIDDLGTVTDKFIECVSNPRIGLHG